ncbi:hypothetical protein DAERI_050211 [Deinococcus aerius]|uniref:Lipoprotein n=1 Tax=Deinococcus aerius TaxID=200253 RepID=A0A2I9CV02_9DEIO|nr:hypothetical protein [Deinococcus aerius]GBF05702.1 hypothetical protein DAERI_050211 [Deinococcus aerius]
MPNLPLVHPACLAVVLLGAVTCGAAAAGNTFQLDGLLAVYDSPSPCLSVAVRVYEGSQLKSQVAVLPTGKVSPVGKSAPLPRFEKGRTYNLQATCLGKDKTFQNSELTFKADGHTVMVAFTKAGFQFRRGGLAY